MVNTVWSVVPPIIAIALALITKEVYVSLLVGILAGALFYTGFHVLGAVETAFQVMGEKAAGGNFSILVFLVLLGILVSVMNKSGASRAYGVWATKTIRSRRGALGATIGLGSLIFVDDYFNCLTVGTIMQPITDKYHITRAKLAYIIDATAAPVCIIAPISSWAAAVGSSLPQGSGMDGFTLFLKTIPFNLYALLTLTMLVVLVVYDFDFGTMKKHAAEGKDAAVKGPAGGDIPKKDGRPGRVMDLVIPIAALIVSSVAFMIYTGGFFGGGVSLVQAFAGCDAPTALVLGAFTTLVITFVLYMLGRVMTFRAFAESIVDGFRAMVPALLILLLAWTLSSICCDYLQTGVYVGELVEKYNIAHTILPAIFFLIALGLAFSTGTSWGTFGILIPIVVPAFAQNSTILVISVAAVLAGAVCGDHISPISDTTIMASTGAQCPHMEHVSTQIPYALTVAAVCLVGFILAGFTQSFGMPYGWAVLLTLGVSLALLLAVLTLLYRRTKA